MAKIDILGFPHAYDLTTPQAPLSSASEDEPPCVLVFIHGWLLSRHYWKPLISRLPDYHCLAYDLRGFGDSLPMQGKGQFHAGYSPAAYARDVVMLLEKLGISRAWLIGHSLGGTIALWAGAYLPKIVQGIICVNSGGGIYIKEEFERFRSAGQFLVKWRPQWLGKIPLVHLMFSQDSVAYPIKRHWGRQRAIDFCGANYEAALGALLDSTTESQVHQLPLLVSRLKQPAYFVAGDRDKVMEPKYVRHLASFHYLYEGGDENTIVLPECGHLSMIEQPDALAGEIRRLVAAKEPILSSS
ncbi:alpha/beta fold hydrolase [[Phormidium] sp. ETS-05]|uniref:alpha/beta fold hydrolase n=1 Tax=[Phormidium] sp. ETS-05 TaxID=222819 RepID=UPI0018EF28AB|nr:alpha/beta hydrolase [[Phormidium] sp. ETS-05]